MSMVDEGTPNPTGEAIFQELLWIHQIIRHNLTTIMDVIEQITQGAPAEQVRAQIEDLASTSIIWTLRVNCMRYCSFVHKHHNFEDAAWFPALRRINPGLHSVIDKLQADHVVVAQLLDEVEAAAQRLASDETARTTLADALHRLAEHLIAHLDYEETSLASTLRSLTTWPHA
ncbi:MAG: hemerythrin domain-containing protein [Chloroflexaceae bacterium]|nr:hemerythrin domain-containing protein [Chloroflexaceae bacterium]